MASRLNGSRRKRIQRELDLKEIRRRWREDSVHDFDEYVGRELARIDVVEHECWRAWRENIGERTVTRKDSNGSFTKTTKITEKHAGNVAYLNGVLRCVDRRARLLGLYASPRRKHFAPDGKPTAIAFISKEDWDAL